MGTILGCLGDLGYGWAYRVLDAQYFGVAQRRRRVFIVGCLGEGARAASVLFDPESGAGDLAPRLASGAIAAGALARSLSAVGGGNDYGANKGTLVAGTLTSKEGGSRTTDLDGHGAYIAHPLVAKSRLEPESETFVYRKAQRAHDPEDCERWEATDQADTLDAGGHTPRTATAVFEPRVARNGRGAPSEIVPPLKAESGSTGKGDGAPHIFSVMPETGQGADLTARELTEGEPSPTVAATEAKKYERGVRISNDLGVRRLTPLECERLQGFPDGWTEGQSDSARYRQLGNAVCVPVARWIGERLRALDHPRGEGLSSLEPDREGIAR